MLLNSRIYTSIFTAWLISGPVHATFSVESVREYLTEAREQIFKDSRQADSLLSKLETHSNYLPDTLIAEVHNIRGIYFAVRGDNDLASRQFFLGLSRAGALSNQYAGILSNLSITLKQSGEREMALRLFRHSLEVYTQHQNFEGIATVLGEMASVHSQRREFYLSVRLLTAAIRIWNTDEVRYRQKRAVDLQKLGNTYLNLDNFEYALKLYKEAREAFRLLGNNYMEALTCIQEADALLGLNQPENALSSLEQSLGIMESFNNVDILAHGYRLRGITLHTLSDSNAEEAKNQLEKALSYSKLGSRIYLVSVLNSMLEFHKKGINGIRWSH
jgi:tetratricopeptide (TPR) repeat protein